MLPSPFPLQTKFKKMLMRKICVPSTFTSISWFIFLFTFCLFTLLYIHPRDTNPCMNSTKIDTENKPVLTPCSNKYVSYETVFRDDLSIDNASYVQVLDSVAIEDDLSTGALVNLTTLNHENGSHGQVLDSAIFELELNLTSNDEVFGNSLIVELPQNIEVASNKDENEDEDEDKDEDYDIIPSFDVFSNPPWKCTRKERINWLKEKLVESKILKSTIKTRNFNGKIQAFLSNNSSNGNVTNCDVTFYFTWISPASLFGKRELLALESVFKTHPEGCVLILSRTMDSKPGRLLLKPLMDLGYRILPIGPDFHYLFSNTPAQEWLERLESGDGDPGTVPITQNLSNLLRMVVLYKYGGVYLDTDVIILKNISGLKNSIGAQSADSETRRWTRLNNAVLIFDKGHPLLWKFMEEFTRTFDGFTWGYNGPYLTTRVVSRVLDDPSNDIEFNIMGPMAFYPINWIRIPRLFEKHYKNGTTWAMAHGREIDSESYGIHLWNKQTRRLKIEKRGEMGRLISEHCIICKDIYDP